MGTGRARVRGSGGKGQHRQSRAVPSGRTQMGMTGPHMVWTGSGVVSAWRGHHMVTIVMMRNVIIGTGGLSGDKGRMTEAGPMRTGRELTGTGQGLTGTGRVLTGIGQAVTGAMPMILLVTDMRGVMAGNTTRSTSSKTNAAQAAAMTASTTTNTDLEMLQMASAAAVAETAVVATACRCTATCTCARSS